ncbi:unnamed protein product [Rhodiola kirilowii]
MKMAEAQLQHQPWRRLLTAKTAAANTSSSQSFSYRNATVILSLFNLLLILLLLRDFSSSSPDQLNSDQHVRESEKIRRSMQPLQLIKTVRDIELENAQLETALHDDQKQTAAVDLSNRLKDIHSSNDAANVKALEEWRKRKMERARKREMERNSTITSQA